MRIAIFTPAPPGSTKGNRITAERWAKLLRESGHDVVVTHQWLEPAQETLTTDGNHWDCLIALHATRSHEAIQNFTQQWPGRPVIVCLTGTDLHLDLPGQRGDQARRQAESSLHQASHLVLLEPQSAAELLSSHKYKAEIHVILQSADAIEGSRASQESPALEARSTNRASQESPALEARSVHPRPDCFEVCVLGHLRDEKDPLLTAEAARDLPADSRIQVTQLGAALSPELKRRAEQEMLRNPRYKWLGAVPHDQAQRTLARCRLMVLTSRVEGAPSAISEAAVNHVPILATEITATLGLLGRDYPGLFAVGDRAGLLEKMKRAESDPDYLAELTLAIKRLSPQFTPEAERDALDRLMSSVQFTTAADRNRAP